jgi:hypothetical protein
LGYEPNELPTAPPRDVGLQMYSFFGVKTKMDMVPFRQRMLGKRSKKIIILTCLSISTFAVKGQRGKEAQEG